MKLFSEADYIGGMSRRPLLTRRAWIETIFATFIERGIIVARFSRGGRGLKHPMAGECFNRCSVARFSRGGRGLKPEAMCSNGIICLGRPLLTRRAWIETYQMFHQKKLIVVARFSRGGRGLKRHHRRGCGITIDVARFSRGGRGLKPYSCVVTGWLRRRPLLTRRAWIETFDTPTGNCGTTCRPLLTRRAWIETAMTRSANVSWARRPLLTRRAWIETFPMAANNSLALRRPLLTRRAWIETIMS